MSYECFVSDFWAIEADDIQTEIIKSKNVVGEQHIF